VTDQGRWAPYSNIGPQIAFVAPSSGGIRAVFTTDVSLENRGYNPGKKEQGGEDGLHTNSFGGTSAATALAAGVGALVLSVHPDLSRAELLDLLKRTVDRIDLDPEALGAGRINPGRAVAEAEDQAP
jgi:subtilisin family serine protease